MTSRIPLDVAKRVEALVKNGAYPSSDEVLRDAMLALDERRPDAAIAEVTLKGEATTAGKPKRQSRRDKSLEKWLAGFDEWVKSHRPIGHFVDDSRDSIYG